MSTILIAGGAGYIGAHVNRCLAEAGHATLVLDNLCLWHRESVQWGRLVTGDAGDATLLDRIFREQKVDAVIHLCAFSQVGESVLQPGKYYRNNVAVTLNLLEAMAKHGVKRFLFSSTCAIFGEPDVIPMHEELPQAPINPYGRSKRMVEEILADYGAACGLQSVCLRYFNAAGAHPDGRIGEDHDPETHLIPLVLDAALGRRPEIKIFGEDYPTPDGTCVRDYIHVCDLAEAHRLALDWMAGHEGSERFNLGNGLGYSVKQVIETARRVTDRPIPAVSAPRRPGDPPTLVGASDKARRVLGWQPQYADLETIIETAWNWHRKRFGEKA